MWGNNMLQQSMRKVLTLLTSVQRTRPRTFYSMCEFHWLLFLFCKIRLLADTPRLLQNRIRDSRFRIHSGESLISTPKPPTMPPNIASQTIEVNKFREVQIIKSFITNYLLSLTFKSRNIFLNLNSYVLLGIQAIY